MDTTQWAFAAEARKSERDALVAKNETLTAQLSAALEVARAAQKVNGIEDDYELGCALDDFEKAYPELLEPEK